MSKTKKLQKLISALENVLQNVENEQEKISSGNKSIWTIGVLTYI